MLNSKELWISQESIFLLEQIDLKLYIIFFLFDIMLEFELKRMRMKLLQYRLLSQYSLEQIGMHPQLILLM